LLSLANTNGCDITRRTRGGQRGPREVEKGEEENGGLVLLLLQLTGGGIEADVDVPFAAAAAAAAAGAAATVADSATCV